jgi:hypothetical protein
MHQLLYHHQKALEDQDLLGYADRLGLDRQRLLADLDGIVAVQALQMLAGNESPEAAVVLALLSLMFSPVWVNANTDA